RAHGPGTAQSRFPRGLRRGLRDLAHLHADQPAGRSGLCLARSARAPAMSPARRRFQLKKWLGLGLTLTALLAALGAPWLAAHDPLRTDFAQSLKPPGGAGHVVGTAPLRRRHL